MQLEKLAFYNSYYIVLLAAVLQAARIRLITIKLY